MCNADTLSVEDIPRLFPDPEFVEAAKVLHMIAQTPEQLMLYNARLKAQRDESGRILQAKLEGEQAAQAKLEAIREKLEAAEAGIAAAEAATAEAQARGIAIGELRGQITLLQRLLKQPVWTDTEFATCDEALLSRTLSELQDRLTSSAP